MSQPCSVPEWRWAHLVRQGMAWYRRMVSSPIHVRWSLPVQVVCVQVQDVAGRQVTRCMCTGLQVHRPCGLCMGPCTHPYTHVAHADAGASCGRSSVWSGCKHPQEGCPMVSTTGPGREQAKGRSSSTLRLIASNLSTVWNLSFHAKNARASTPRCSTSIANTYDVEMSVVSNAELGTRSNRDGILVIILWECRVVH